MERIEKKLKIVRKMERMEKNWNALQYFTRATLDGNLQEKCRAPTWAQNTDSHFVSACAVDMHVNMSQGPLYTEIYKKNAVAQLEHPDQALACKNPSVWTSLYVCFLVVNPPTKFIVCVYVKVNRISQVQSIIFSCFNLIFVILWWVFAKISILVYSISRMGQTDWFQASSKPRLNQSFSKVGGGCFCLLLRCLSAERSQCFGWRESMRKPMPTGKNSKDHRTDWDFMVFMGTWGLIAFTNQRLSKF